MTRPAFSNALRAANAAHPAPSQQELELVRTLQARIEALVTAGHGLDAADPEEVSRALLLLDELRLDPLGPVVVQHPLLETLLEQFDALRDAVPDGSAVVEAQQALDALTSSQAVAGTAELFERAEALERAAVALSRVHGEAGRVAQEALDDLALRIRDGAAPQALTVLRESVQAQLDALKLETVAQARRALTEAAPLEAALHQGIEAPSAAALPDTSPTSTSAAPAQASPAMPQRPLAPEPDALLESDSGPSVRSASETPAASRVLETATDRAEPVQASTDAEMQPLKALRAWLAEDAKHLSDEALGAAFEPSLIERALRAGLTAPDVRRARSLLRTAARSAGQNAQRIDLAIALEALVESGVSPASLPQPGAPVRTAPSAKQA